MQLAHNRTNNKNIHWWDVHLPFPIIKLTVNGYSEVIIQEQRRPSVSNHGKLNSVHAGTHTTLNISTSSNHKGREGGQSGSVSKNPSLHGVNAHTHSHTERGVSDQYPPLSRGGGRSRGSKTPESQRLVKGLADSETRTQRVQYERTGHVSDNYMYNTARVTQEE